MIEKVINEIIKCWFNGELKFFTNKIPNKQPIYTNKEEILDNSGTFDDFKEINKSWKNALPVIEKMNIRSDYFDPFILDIYSIDDIPLNEPFNILIKGDNIWLMMKNEKYNMGCNHIVANLYGTHDKNIHIILNRFNYILNESYINYTKNNKKKYKKSLKKLKTKYKKLYSFLNKNRKLLKLDNISEGSLRKTKKSYNIRLNKNTKKKTIKTLKNIIKKEGLNMEISSN